MTRNVLVIGGAGYIGSHTCKKLSEAGYVPVTYDNLCLGQRKFVKWGPLVEADVHDTATLIDTIRRFEPVGILHFAAFAYVGESVIDPRKYYHNNVVGILSVLAAMMATQIRRLVFSSTCAVYGVPVSLPITEQTPTQPINPYGWTKLMCEQIIADYAAAYPIEAVALRYFNASGCDVAALIGEQRETETHLIPRAMMFLQGHLRDFQIFGCDYPTPDGTAIRDYVHVNDLARAHVAALTHPLGDEPFRVFNLGGGTGYSVKQVLREIAKVAGRDLPAASGRRRPGDPPELVADISHAQRILGFEPIESSLRSIIETAWRWHGVAHPRRPAMVF